MLCEKLYFLLFHLFEKWVVKKRPCWASSGRAGSGWFNTNIKYSVEKQKIFVPYTIKKQLLRYRAIENPLYDCDKKVSTASLLRLALLWSQPRVRLYEWVHLYLEKCWAFLFIPRSY